CRRQRALREAAPAAGADQRLTQSGRRPRHRLLTAERGRFERGDARREGAREQLLAERLTGLRRAPGQVRLPAEVVEGARRRVVAAPRRPGGGAPEERRQRAAIGTRGGLARRVLRCPTPRDGIDVVAETARGRVPGGDETVLRSVGADSTAGDHDHGERGERTSQHAGTSSVACGVPPSTRSSQSGSSGSSVLVLLTPW